MENNMNSDESAARQALSSGELFNEVSIDISTGPLFIGAIADELLPIDRLGQIIDARFGMGTTQSAFLSSNNSGKCIIYHVGIPNEQPEGYSVAGYFVFFPDFSEEPNREQVQNGTDV
jgi:hypothetical protein